MGDHQAAVAQGGGDGVADGGVEGEVAVPGGGGLQGIHHGGVVEEEVSQVGNLEAGAFPGSPWAVPQGRPLVAAVFTRSHCWSS